MEIINKIDELRKVLNGYRRAGKVIGLVPTMGYLHEGHLSLIDVARKQSDVVVVSLFVNPTQFGPNEDLDRYPRDFERDERLARDRGADIIFYPDVGEMYPAPFFTYIVTEQLSKVLCGVSRPVHFRGVTTIVAKLFNIVQPDIAVFGRKDAQQAVIIQRMVTDLNFPVEIVVAPIVREPDGLAMSSRNKYLSDEERKQAPVIRRALRAALQLFQGGEKRADQIKYAVHRNIETAALANIEYIEIVDQTDLTSVETIEQGNLLAVAVRFGNTRLIDNLVFSV